MPTAAKLRSAVTLSTTPPRLASRLSGWTAWAVRHWLVAAFCVGGSAAAVARGESLQFDGFVEPLDNIRVAALEMGNLQELRVQVGDRVQEGDVIAVLDDSLQSSAVDIARLQANMQGQRQAAAAERDLHASRMEKLRQLEMEGLARPDELRRAQTDLRIAQARLLAVEEEQQLRAAELRRYELQLNRRKIRAPISGTVAELFRKAGEFVSPSDPSIVQLITTDRLVAVVSIPAEYAGSIAPGARARVQLAMVSEGVDGQVQSVAPAIEGESGTVQIRVLLANPSGLLRAGDRCTVTFPEPLLRSVQQAPPESGRVAIGSGRVAIGSDR